MLARVAALLALSSVGLGGCGAPQNGATPSGSGSVGTYEVHEWGLLRAGMNDVLDVGAVPPRRAPMPMVVDKPILYFHANGSVRIATVGVEAIGGSIREHWPLTTRARMPPMAIAWRDVALDGASLVSASSCSSMAFPTASDRPCTDLEPGEHCESAELRSAIARGAACVAIDGASAPFLFYRSRTSTFTPPLRVARSSATDLRATNAGDAAIPGWIVRIRQEGGQVRALAVRPPAPGETIVIGDDFSTGDVATDETTLADRRTLPGDPAPGRRAVEDTMREIGLTDEEIAAFLRAWDETLFGLPARDAAGVPRDDMPVDVLSQDGELGPIDSILYFLPESACAQVARLTFDPPPRAVRRALAVWARVL